jgi:hypothetical protein
LDQPVTDKNKSAYKLKNFGPVYCINLDGQPERWEYMENQFKYWEVDNYTRISAYDGRDDDLSDIIKGKYPENMSSGEVGCTTSHLKAMKHYLETSDSPYAIMMEDDCSLDLVRFWNFKWNELYAHFPYDYDVVQLAIICTGDIHVRLHKKLDQGVKPRPVADDLIYNSGNSFAIPLLVYKFELGSSIHPVHVDAYHKQNYEAQVNYWTQNGANIDIADYMNYDPYLGRVTESSAQQQ